MSTLTAFAMGQANRGKSKMVFDWDAAARLIKEHRPSEASAGLRGDWEWTGGSIWANGAPVPKDETCTYLASTWATPELDMDGDLVACFVMEGDVPSEWGDEYSEIYWPASALALVAASE